MADVSIMRALSRSIVTFFGAALPVEYAHPKVGALGPAGGASEGAESRCSAPGAAYGSYAGLYVLF